MKNSSEINNVGNHNIKRGKLLAQGGFGLIYKGRWNKQKIVIKKLSPIKDEAENLSNLQYFKDEMILHKKLSHPNIVQLLIFQYDSTNISRCFMVLEFIKSGDLCDFLKKNTDISLKWQISILEQVTQALNYLHHTLRIIHRDLKAENVLLKPKKRGARACPQVKLCDFGFAKELPLSEDSFQDKHRVGTREYFAPEIITSKIYSFQSDVYALGMIAYTLSAKATPFFQYKGDNSILSIIEGGGRPAIPDSVPEQFSNFIVQCWQQDPKARPFIKDLLTDDLINELGSKKNDLDTTKTQDSTFFGMRSKSKPSKDNELDHDNKSPQPNLSPTLC